MPNLNSGHVALAVGTAGSCAANLAWAWGEPVRMVAGVFATALVPVGMHLWPRIPIPTTKALWLRRLVMTYICLAAAVVNLVHAVWLLVGHPNRAAENVVLAVLLITAVEALMVMASLSRRHDPTAAPATVADLVASQTTTPQAASVAVPTPPATDATTPRGPDLPVILHGGEPVPDATVAAARELLAEKPAAGRGLLMKQLGVTDTLARKLLDELRPLAVAA